MIDDIYTRTPVNKQSAIAVSQSDCEDERSIYQIREDLAKKYSHLQRELFGLPKGHDIRKKIGQELHCLARQLQLVNKEVKKENVCGVGLTEYIVKVCRDRFSKPEWKVILNKATELKKEAIAKAKNSHE